MKKSMSGFTIVELLIVVVVIAILAAISIVAYRGIQQRASNSKTVSAVTSYVKALNLYKADHGQHPPTGQSCLGDDYSSTGCDANDSFLVDRNGLNTTYLAPYFNSSVPMPAATLGEFTTGRQFGGAVYAWNSSTFGGADNGGIGLYHQGSGNCPVIGGLTPRSTQVYVDGSGRFCRYSID